MTTVDAKTKRGLAVAHAPERCLAVLRAVEQEPQVGVAQLVVVGTAGAEPVDSALVELGDALKAPVALRCPGQLAAPVDC